jgi:hypothetical protein
MSEHQSSGNFPWACVGQATTVAANRQSLAARRRRRVVSIRRGIGTAGEPIEESRAEFLPSTLLGGRLRAAQRKLWAWVDLNVIDLGRQMHLSHLPPLMVYMAAGISGLTAIVGTFFVKGYLGLSAVACRLVQPPKIGLVRLGPQRSMIRRSYPSNLTP